VAILLMNMIIDIFWFSKHTYMEDLDLQDKKKNESKEYG
jgi:hypothetical protein